jgi:hypothetical protein
LTVIRTSLLTDLSGGGGAGHIATGGQRGSSLFARHDRSRPGTASQGGRSSLRRERPPSLHTGPVEGRRATLCLSNSSGRRHEHLPNAGWLRQLTRLGGVSPVRCCRACLAPFVQLAAAPSHSANTKPHWAGELLLGHEPVNRGSSQARHLHDGWHAQEHRRCLVLCFER